MGDTYIRLKKSSRTAFVGALMPPGGENDLMYKFARRTFNQFIHSQSLGGIVLALAALLALLVSNSPFSEFYIRFLQWPGELRIGGDWLVLSKSLLHWVNDLWMAVFLPGWAGDQAGND